MLFAIAAVSILLFGSAVFAEQRRSRRRDPDRVGFMPWTLIQLIAVLTALFCVAWALIARQ